MTATITGAAALTSVGATLSDTFAALLAGRDGLGPLHGFDHDRFRTRVAYEIDDRPALGHDVPLRATSWLTDVIAAAVRDAGLAEDLRDVPVLIGTTLRELRSVELAWRGAADFAATDLDFAPALLARFAASRTYTIANACAASLYALGLGTIMLDLGEADTVVVAGVDAFTETTHGLLDRCYPSSPDRIRPFDRDRRGMIHGEGAAAVVLTNRPTHGAAVVVRGVAVSCDARHPSAPDAARVEQTVRDAHRIAGVRAEDVGLVVLHGTGTPLNDEAEASAVTAVFAGVTTPPLMTGIKSMTGHTGGASGLHSLLTAVEAMRAGVVPAITGLDEPIEAATGLRLVRSGPAPTVATVAQVNSFGFGGLNAVAVVERVS
jgi:3-oxoacyl-[acyl-carrier-protein] synthase II